ncbi:MAG: DUF499 domain-containing protein [Opitutales bacterium]|nr:DUF499 domain-containing protein [Opitutales bacterium]
MSLTDLCIPRESTFSTNRRATVLSLDEFLLGRIDAKAFFAENYFTGGMTTLVDRVFRQISGKSTGSSVFQLSQAMGGGKTHSMIGLGLLAQDPALRAEVMKDGNPAPDLEACRVIGFNGRSTDKAGGIWGALAEQLGKEAQFARYVSPMLSAPGPEAWKHLFGEEPLIIFLDELPPYLEYAVSVPVGNGDLGIVTTAALGNLFVAVAEMDNVSLVLSDLAGTNYTAGQQRLQTAVDRAVQGIAGEAKRIAIPITPVDPNGDELYHILRKRLFKEIPESGAIEPVARAYSEALREAQRMGLTSSSPEALHARVLDAYPFHPDLRSLVGRFKENDGFQQTRGVIRLMQMVVARLWQSGKAKTQDLVHPYDIDLNHDEIASEIRTINGSLSEAIANDIAHGGSAEAEEIDGQNGHHDASDTAKLILVASLSTTPGAVHGLREFELVDCLQRPGRDLSNIKVNVFDKLAMRAWYLHNSADGRLFFKNQQNLAAKLRSTAQSLHGETVERLLRDHLESYFAPSLRDCYQTVKVLPPPDQVQLEAEKTTLVIVRPGGLANQLPISPDWQAWWEQQQYKNRVLFLSGSRDTFQKVLDGARQTRALDSIETDLKAEATPAGDPQWQALDTLRDRITLQFSAALKEAFDQIVYPSINSALRSTAIDLAFAGNQNGEATLRKTLEGVQKFTVKIDDDSFRTRAEARLFGSTETKVVLWSDLKRNAAVNTTWPLHKPSALEDLRAECVRRDLWREEGNHVRRGPFPPPEPEVSVRTLSVEEDAPGYAYLKVDPLHAPGIVFETGDSEPTPASSPVPTPARFEAKALRYRFRAIDPEHPDRVSHVKDWTATLRLKQRLIDRGDHLELELQALPHASDIVIRYTTDGSSPINSGAARYDGPIRVPARCRVICAVAVAEAYQLNSAVLTVQIPRKGEEGRQLDPVKPARWAGRLRLDDTGAVWDFIGKMEKAAGTTAHDISLTAENADGQQHLEFTGAVTEGYTGAVIKLIAEQMQQLAGEGSLRMHVNSLSFPSGQGLLDWLRATNRSLDLSEVTQ